MTRNPRTGTCQRRTSQSSRQHVTTGLAFVCAFLIVPAQAQESPRTSTGLLEEIVVTATRREERSQDVPISITAISGDTIRSLGIVSSYDLEGITPGLQLQSPFATTSPQWNIRGVGSNGFLANDVGGVGIYVDDVYINSNVGQGFTLYDTERVEVIRGPQGTLFGANTTGGAIQFVSRRPSKQLGANASVTIGNFGTRRFSGGIDLPLGETVGMRVAFISDENEGYGYNAFLNENAQITDMTAWRATLVYQPRDDFELLLRTWRGVSTGSEYTLNNQGTLDPVTFTACSSADIAAFRCVDLFGFNERATYSDYNTHEADQRAVSDVITKGASLSFTWDFDDVSLISISAFNSNERIVTNNIDASRQAIATEEYDSENEQVTQELRLVSTGDGALQWVAGLFYLSEDVDDLYVLNLPIIVIGQARDYELTNTNVAAYGELNYALSDNWSLTAGLRFSDEEKEVTDYFARVFDQTAFQANVLTTEAFRAANELVVTIDNVDINESWSELTGRLVLDYAVSDDILTYASYSRGFRGGNFAGGVFNLSELVTVEPELAEAYELGVKADFWDGKARLNASVFNTEYTDLQVVTVRGTFTGLANAADATITGGEVELTLAPNERLFTNFGLAFLDAKYDTFVSSLGDFSGNDLENSPEISFNGLLRYDVPAGKNTLSLQTDFSYKGDNFKDFSNVIQSEQEAYWLFNASATISPPDSRYSIKIWGRNLGDEEYMVNWFDVSVLGFNGINVGTPRTYGVTFSVDIE